MNTIIKTFIIYFIFFLFFSVLLKLTLKNHIQPIAKNNAYRILGVIPLREAIIIPPISFIVWFYISKNVSREKIHISIILYQSIIAMFLTGFIIHKIFGVKSKLGSILHLTNKPDGTGQAPYSNY